MILDFLSLVLGLSLQGGVVRIAVDKAKSQGRPTTDLMNVKKKIGPPTKLARYIDKSTIDHPPGQMCVRAQSVKETVTPPPGKTKRRDLDDVCNFFFVLKSMLSKATLLLFSKYKQVHVFPKFVVSSSPRLNSDNPPLSLSLIIVAISRLCNINRRRRLADWLLSIILRNRSPCNPRFMWSYDRMIGHALWI